MALAQTYKDYFHVNPDKENSALNANITTRKASFLIKKNPKLVAKPVARTNGRILLEPIENQASQKEKLATMTANLKELGLTKKLNAYKVKKALAFDNGKENSKKEMPELVHYKERLVVPPKSRSQQISKESFKATTLPEIGTKPIYRMAAKSENNLDDLKEDSADRLDGIQDDEDDHWVLEKGAPCDISRVSRSQKDESEQPFVIDPKDMVSHSLKEYCSEIIETLKEREEKIWAGRCLKNHKITPALRSKMVDWMIEVMCSYKCSDFAFFLAVSVMDTFFEKTQRVHTANDLHLTGVTCLFMAAKFEEIYPMRLAVIHEKIAHRKLSLESILEKEGEILQALNYNITSATVYDYLTNVLYQLDLKGVLGTDMSEYLSKVCVYLCKANMYDYELLSQYSHCEMAACTLFVAFKVIEQLDNSFPLSIEMERVCEILQVDSGILYPCASKILALAKNFETIYPQFKNLKKFHSIGGNKENPMLDGTLNSNSNNKTKTSS